MTINPILNGERRTIDTSMPKPRVRATQKKITSSRKKKRVGQTSGSAPEVEEIDPLIQEIKDEIEKLKRELGEPDDGDGDNNGGNGDSDDDFDKLNKELQDLREKKLKKLAEGEKGADEVETIVLPDGSIFIARKKRSVYYDFYYYVVYDWWTHWHEKKVYQNWWTQVDKWEIVDIDYIYVSGPTREIPSRSYKEKKDTYKYDYCSCEWGDASAVWKEGRNDVGDEPNWRERLTVTDTFLEFQNEFESWMSELEQEHISSGIGKVNQSDGDQSDDDNDHDNDVPDNQPVTGGEDHMVVNLPDSGAQVILPADFFLTPHTLKELIELRLIDGDSLSQGLLDNLSRDEILFYLQYYPYTH